MNRINSNYAEDIMRSTSDTAASYGISDEEGARKKVLDNRQ
jgi:hypothetical protein